MGMRLLPSGQIGKNTAMLKRMTLLWAVLRGDLRQMWFALRHPDALGWLKLV